MFEPAKITDYTEHALVFSPSIVSTKQAIIRYENELKYLTKYKISENLSYYKEKLQSVELNLAVLRLTLEKNELSLIQSIEEQYNTLLLEKEKVGLAGLSLEIAETDHEINKGLYNRKLIDYSELMESEQSVEIAALEYQAAVYKYNTMLLELEYDCAWFMPEDEQ